MSPSLLIAAAITAVLHRASRSARNSQREVMMTAKAEGGQGGQTAAGGAFERDVGNNGAECRGASDR